MAPQNEFFSFHGLIPNDMKGKKLFILRKS